MEKIKKNQEKTEISASGAESFSSAKELRRIAINKEQGNTAFSLPKEEAEKRKKEETEKKKKRAAAKAYRDKYFAYYDDVKTKVSEDW